MKRVLLLSLCLLLFSSCTSRRVADSELPGLEVSEVNPDKRTALAKQNLKQLAQVYDLGPFLFTKKVQVSSSGQTFVAGVVTLDTKFADAPNKLLARLLHSELHLWAAGNRKKLVKAILELRKIYPEAPRETNLEGRPDPHLHLIIAYLEHEALAHYLGKKEARNVLTALMRRHKLFPWTYFQILNKSYAVKRVIERHRLLFPPL